MKTDFYTKSILTVIALCLVIIVLRGTHIIPMVHATETLRPLESERPEYGWVPINEDGSITVRLSDHNMIDVNIADITTSDELDVNIDEVGGGYVSSGGPVEVKIVE